MWSPRNHLMAAAGYPDSNEDAAAYLAATTDGAMTEDEIGWYVRTSAEAVHYLDAKTRVSYRPLDRPDYHLDLPGAATARGLDNEAFDPSGFPALAESIRQPTYFPLISMAERDALQRSSTLRAVQRQGPLLRNGHRTAGRHPVCRLHPAPWCCPGRRGEGQLGAGRLDCGGILRPCRGGSIVGPGDAQDPTPRARQSRQLTPSALAEGRRRHHLAGRGSRPGTKDGSKNPNVHLVNMSPLSELFV